MCAALTSGVPALVLRTHAVGAFGASAFAYDLA